MDKQINELLEVLKEYQELGGTTHEPRPEESLRAIHQMGKRTQAIHRGNAQEPLRPGNEEYGQPLLKRSISKPSMNREKKKQWHPSRNSC